MPKCERCGLNSDGLELKVCPDKISDWGNKSICKKCYMELKKIDNDKNLKEKYEFQYSLENNILGKKKIKRSILVYFLVTLWIVIGVLFIGAIYHKYSEYSDYIGMYDRFGGPNSFTNAMTFNYIAFIILFIIVITIAFLLAFFTFIKKSQSWLLGLMFSSFLLYFAFQAIHFIGFGVISGNLHQFSRSFEYITYMCMLIISPLVILILTRPEVKAYFGKIWFRIMSPKVYKHNYILE